jgi:hypothetical protein
VNRPAHASVPSEGTNARSGRRSAPHRRPPCATRSRNQIAAALESQLRKWEWRAITASRILQVDPVKAPGPMNMDSVGKFRES